jgi:hypothetical protein
MGRLRSFAMDGIDFVRARLIGLVAGRPMCGHVLPFILLVAAMLFQSAVLAHGRYDWIAKYVNAVGMNCCGEMDCRDIPDSAAQGLGIGSTITINFHDGPRQVKVNRIYATEDGSAYVCKPGCLFRNAAT